MPKLCEERLRRFVSLGFFLAAVMVSRPAAAADWPNWRGPDQNGTSRETGLPIEWSEDSGVVWKCPLPEWGNSTPVVFGDAIFLTSQVDDRDLLLLKLDKRSGRIEWSRPVGTGSANRELPDALLDENEKPRGGQKFHHDQNLASASVATDGSVVIAQFGNGDLAGYDFRGHRLWKRNLQEDHGRYTIWWGHANSPVLCGDLVISVTMQDSCLGLWDEPSPSYLVAHDKRTGRLKWKTMRMTSARAEHCDSYATPLLWQNAGRTEMIVMGGEGLDAYDPATGRRLWQLPGLEGNRVITGPPIADGVIYTTRGMRGPLVAVRPGGLGPRPPEDVLWQYDRATPDTPVPVVWKGLLFMVSDRGIATCLDARTGEAKWRKRLPGSYRASPLAAEDRVYFLNMEGLATVVAAANEFRLLAENRLDDITLASPAVSSGRIYLRGHKTLYCLGE